MSKICPIDIIKYVLDRFQSPKRIILHMYNILIMIVAPNSRARKGGGRGGGGEKSGEVKGEYGRI